jgi:hypothetical protein
MVNSEKLRSQRLIDLPFTLYCLPNAMRHALCSMRSQLTHRIRFSLLEYTHKRLDKENGSGTRLLAYQAVQAGIAMAASLARLLGLFCC